MIHVSDKDDSQWNPGIALLSLSSMLDVGR